ncbi:hypothetical protein [Flavobacterium sp. 25HG05S-40]|uniref:hypothetical protein n=1 Tax=Flavobacterium sp. 25HG05S-40 TaxID=3458682 RepID=UPI0040446C11
MASANYEMLIEMRDKIVDYLEEEKKICEDALKAYEPGAILDSSEEIRVMREREAIKLRDRVYELRRHIQVIKAMYPNT